MKHELAESALVFLVPLFGATIFNNFRRKNVRANMKVVYYKFFIFCSIMFLASQISIQITQSSSIDIAVRIFGEILMMMLVFEFFLVPTKDTHPDDVAIVHTSVLWLVGFLFVALCCFNHFPEIANTNKNWKIHPIFGILSISKKVYQDCSLPSSSSGVKTLPICNLFSYVKHV